MHEHQWHWVPWFQHQSWTLSKLGQPPELNWFCSEEGVWGFRGGRHLLVSHLATKTLLALDFFHSPDLVKARGPTVQVLETTEKVSGAEVLHAWCPCMDILYFRPQRKVA